MRRRTRLKKHAGKVRKSPYCSNLDRMLVIENENSPPD
jgi:hypothetical protein